jgi:cobalt-zinc-cadmium efflux system outer membrane protein
MVQNRSGYRTHWESGPPTDEQIATWVDRLLQGGLTRDHAVEIALVNSPSLQSTYEELGVSQADMVQAGLLKNPRLSGSLGFPLAGERVEYETSLVQDFLDLFVLPLRKRVAKEQFIAHTLRVAHETLRFAAEVKETFVELQSRTELVEVRRTIVQTAQAGAELALRQHEAGNTTNLELSQQTAAYEQARLDMARDELSLVEAREHINRLLGLWGPKTDWLLAEKLPELPAKDPPLEHLEAMAIRQRLDVDAARKQVFLMWNALELARTSRLFGVVEVGIHTHQDPDGARLLGPTLSLELPIFDQRQAVIARFDALYRQAIVRLNELSINIRSRVRLARTRLAASRLVVERYQKVLLPLRELTVEQSQLEYNAMQIGLYELLAAKQSQVEAYRSYLEALRDYWNTWTELELELGGRIVRSKQ